MLTELNVRPIALIAYNERRQSIPKNYNWN
jgi:hypothetical protein